MCPIGISNHTFHYPFHFQEIEAHRRGFRGGRHDLSSSQDQVEHRWQRCILMLTCLPTCLLSCLPSSLPFLNRNERNLNAKMSRDTLPEWSKGVDSSSTSASCVGSNPTGVILAFLYARRMFAQFLQVLALIQRCVTGLENLRCCQVFAPWFACSSLRAASQKVRDTKPLNATACHAEAATNEPNTNQCFL